MIRTVCPALNLICESVAMTSHPDPESTTPAPDRDDSPDESPEQQTVPAVESDVVESDAEATIAGPHASGPPAGERTVVDDPGTVTHTRAGRTSVLRRPVCRRFRSMNRRSANGKPQTFRERMFLWLPDWLPDLTTTNAIQ